MSVVAGEVAPVTCSVCAKAQAMGGAVRCRACGRWVPRVDRFKANVPTAPLGHAGFDRRTRNRLPDPPCPRCEPDRQQARVTIRLPYRIFFKCDNCCSVWTLEVRRR